MWHPCPIIIPINHHHLHCVAWRRHGTNGGGPATSTATTMSSLQDTTGGDRGCSWTTCSSVGCHLIGSIDLVVRWCPHAEGWLHPRSESPWKVPCCTSQIAQEASICPKRGNHRRAAEEAGDHEEGGRAGSSYKRKEQAGEVGWVVRERC